MEQALEITQLITNIIIIILFIGLVIMVFGLIKQLKKITEKVEGFSTGFDEIKPKVIESIDKLNLLSDNVNTAMAKVNENIDVVGTVVEKFKDTADSIIDFEKKVQGRIEPPVLDTVNTISAVSVGIKTFFDSLMNGRSRRVRVSDSELKFEDRMDGKVDDLADSVDDVNKELDEINARLTDLQK